MNRPVRNETEREAIMTLIRFRKVPFSVEIINGVRRTDDQNRMQRMLCNIIAEQIGETAEQVRGYSKLAFGVPILRAESEIFREKYDRLIKPRPYEEKLELMMEPIDFPVTRLMTVRQKVRFLDEMQQHFAKQGVVYPQDMRGIAA